MNNTFGIAAEPQICPKGNSALQGEGFYTRRFEYVEDCYPECGQIQPTLS